MAEVTILDVRFAPSLEPARLGKTDAVVYYSVNKGPALTVRVPRETFSEAKVKEAITQDQGLKGQVANKTYTL